MAPKKNRFESGGSANERAKGEVPSSGPVFSAGESCAPGMQGPPQPEAPQRQKFPVIGIGASAGGIAALREFFRAMPPDSGMAFVVILHLDPLHDSHIAEILAKYTAMKVMEAADGRQVRPNRVFVNLPGRAVTIHDGHLVLGKPVERHRIVTAIDQFLISLAEDQGERAIGIILSGSTAADGRAGVRTIHAAGGMCMAQDPQTTEFRAMPQGAIETGVVDHVLPVDQMPAALLAYAKHLQTQPTRRDEPSAGLTSGDPESV